GGERGLTVGDSSGTIPISVSIGGGRFSYTQAGPGQGFAYLSWGADGDRNLNLDLAGSIYTAFRTRVPSLTRPGSLFMRVATAADSEHPSFGRSFAAFDGNGIVGPGSHLLRFTDFVPDDGPGADFTNIDYIGLEYQPTGAGGIELASFQLFPASLP